MLESKSSALTNLATPLHGLTAAISRPPMIVAGGPSQQRMNLQIAAFPGLPSRRSGLQGLPGRQQRENRAARTRHPALQSLRAQPFERLGDGRAKSLCDGLQIVAGLAIRKMSVRTSSNLARRVCSKA